MSPRSVRLLLALSALAMVVFCASRIRFGTDVTHFLPSDDASQLAALSRQIADTELTRTLILSVSAEDPELAGRAADALATRLRAHPEVARVRQGPDPELARQVYEVYFPRRHLFLSADPELEIPPRTTDAALGQAAQRAREQLLLPSGTLLEEILPADPLGSFPALLERLRAGGERLSVRGGRYTSEDGASILFTVTRASGFDSRAQSELQAFLADEVDELQAAHGSFVLEQSGVSRYAVHAEQSIRRDMTVIVLCSFFGVAVLFFAFMRSPARFGLAVLPSALGILTATTAGLAVFGELDGITLAFATSLLGVAIDYPIHLINHWNLSPAGTTPAAVARELRPALTLGALTTMASFAGLGLTAFPGFQEIAFVAVLGVGTALLVTLFALPPLLVGRREATPLAEQTAAALGGLATAVGRHRRALALLTLAPLLFAIAGLSRLSWNDELRALAATDPALVAEDQRVRARVSRFDAGRFVITTGADAEEALRRNDQVAARLEGFVAEGALEDVQGIHRFVWSRELQHRNWSVLTAQPDLAARVDRAYVGAGFHAGTLAPFEAELGGEEPSPLALDAFLASPLGEAVRAWVLDLGDEVGLVTFVRGVADDDALAQAVAEIPGARFFDQARFIDDVYGAFRATTVRQLGTGSLLVLFVLALRYRRLRPAAAAFLPSALVALLLVGGFAAAGVELTLLHVVSLLLVMGMGVDYGIFLIDSRRDPRTLAATLLSLLLSCSTTLLVFGTLALSDQPALRAMGLTTGIGIALSLVLAPAVFVIVHGEDR